jgi:hypothetical protein
MATAFRVSVNKFLVKFCRATPPFSKFLDHTKLEQHTHTHTRIR